MKPRNEKGETDKAKEKERKRKKEEEPSALAIASTSSDEIASEPNPKKSKMEKGLPATHKKGPEEDLTVSTATTFEKILEASTFVDKTLFIKTVFQTESEENGKTYKTVNKHPVRMITAPRRFGKSVNLDMLGRFLELEVDKTGKKKTDRDLKSETVDDTPNYKLFTETKNKEKLHLQIMADDEFVKTHFGKYPIIKVSFLCRRVVRNEMDAVNICKKSIHEAFLKHPYLYENSKSQLKVYERDACELWCTEEGIHGNRNYKHIDSGGVIDGLKHLSRYLKKFHGRNVFVLIDEFDSIVSKAVDTVIDKDELKKIIGVVTGVIGTVVKENYDNLAGVLMTGILDLHGTGISTLLGNVKRETFGEDTPLLKYYGFNLEEVKKLFEIFSVDEGLRKKAITKYNGYYTKRGEHGIFNPYAIVRFLQNRKKGEASLQNYWQESGYVQSLDDLFQRDLIRKRIERMLKGEWFQVTDRFPNELDLDNLTELHIANRNPKAYISIDLVSLFLLRQGYLSYTPKRGSRPTGIGIPNDLRSVFSKKMVKYLIEDCGMNDDVHQACQIKLNNVMHVVNKDKAEFTRALTSFTGELGELIGTTSVNPCNEAGIEGIVSSVVYTAGYTCGNQISNSERNRLDIIAHRDGQGFIIELKYNQENSRGALIQLLTQGYYKVFKEDKHYDSDIKLNLVMGLHFTEKIEGSKVKATVHCLRHVEINEVLKELNIEKVDRKGTEIVTETRIALACAGKEGLDKFVAKAICVPNILLTS